MPHSRWFNRTANQDFNISGPRHLVETSIDWNNQHHRRIIMSSLVNGVYTLKSDHLENRQGGNALAPPWWENFHFEKTENLHDPTKKNTIFGAIFKFKSPNCNNHDDMISTTRPPKYVIAFRGTSLEPNCITEDMKNNIRVVFSRLHNCGRIEVAMKAVKETIEQNGGIDTIWLAGHSLGAAIALTIGRDLVLQKGFHLPTYLFNPPCAHIPAAVLAKSDFIKQLTRLSRSILTVAVAVATRKGYRKYDEEFNKLSNWVPKIFVNPRDRICKEYLGYFQNREWMESVGLGNIEKISTQHSIAIIIRGAKPSHLLPVAYLTSNKDKSQKAHSLKQWWVPQEAFMGEYRTYDKFWELPQGFLGEDGK